MTLLGMSRISSAAAALALFLTLGAGQPDPARPSAVRTSVVGPDFNGDGFADLAIGAPREDVGTKADAGAVHVLYGSASGVQAVAPDDQFWTQDGADAGDPSEAGDQFGYAVAPGDFNGDGYADLAAGVPFEDLGSVVDAGAVTVLYGSSAGLQISAPAAQTWSQDSPKVEDTAEAGDQFGCSVTSGDFNGDGFADLALGVLREDVGTITDAGAAAVLYGSSAGIQADSPADQGWSQDSSSVQDAAETSDEFGYAVGSGDFDDDGYDDLAIGAHFEDIGGRDAGVAHVLYGSIGGVQAVAPDDQRWAQGRDGVEDLLEANDRFGHALAPGDFNGDGYADLAVGVPFEDVGSEPRVSNAGAVDVLYGSAAGLQATAPDDQYWNQDTSGVIGLAESPDQFGYSVAAGDFDGDGYDDLAAGVRYEDGGPETVPRSGAVNILYGSAAGIQAAGDWHLDQDGQDVAGNQVEDLAEQDDWFGWSVGSDDFNADGFPDLAIGAIGEEEGASPDSGGVQVLYGSQIGLQTGSPDDRLWSQEDPDMADPAEPGDQFGFALSGSTSSH
jgi:hypothetical protein